MVEAMFLIETSAAIDSFMLFISTENANSSLNL